MYRIGKRRRFRKSTTFLGVLIVVGSISFGLWGLLMRDVKGVVVSSDDRLITTRVAGATTDEVVIDEPLFKLNLPGDWVLQKKDDRPVKAYYFKSAKGGLGDGGRTLVLYIDGQAGVYSMNRVVPVSAQGNKLSLGQISDNCAQFTGPGASSAQAAQSLPDTVARWQNISFLCDLSHVNRNATGISSAEGMNYVSVIGPSGATHRYFMLYTDHNDQPDYTIFNGILTSFEAK